MATGVPSKKKRQHVAYELTYPDKMPSSQILTLPAAAGERIDCGSMEDHLYLGDNLGVLLTLLHDTSVRGKVRCIYIDPPYATAMAFVDRNVNHAYDDVLQGAAYVEFLRRRLLVLRQLLAEDGSIFVHLDQNMAFEAKLIMDEVFGRDRFRNFITRKKCNTKNYTRRSFGNIADYILFYSKSDTCVWHRQYEAWAEQRIAEEYPYIDKASGRRYKRVPVHAPGVRHGATGTPWRGKLPPPGKHWQYTPTRLDELDRVGEIYWSANGNPRRKLFYDPAKGIPVQDIWMGFKDAHNQNIRITGYPTEKNFDMLTRIIAATTNPGDLVLDCFCGSGTTLEAARALGRRFIGIDNSRSAIETTAKRLAGGREFMGDFVTRKKPPHRPSDLPSLFDADVA